MLCWKQLKELFTGWGVILLRLPSIGYSADTHLMKLKNKNIWKMCQRMPALPVQLSGLPQVILIKYANSTRVLKEFMFCDLALSTATGFLEIGPWI